MSSRHEYGSSLYWQVRTLLILVFNTFRIQSISIKTVYGKNLVEKNERQRKILVKRFGKRQHVCIGGGKVPGAGILPQRTRLYSLWPPPRAQKTLTVNIWVSSRICLGVFSPLLPPFLALPPFRYIYSITCWYYFAVGGSPSSQGFAIVLYLLFIKLYILRVFLDFYPSHNSMRKRCCCMWSVTAYFAFFVYKYNMAKSV